MEAASRGTTTPTRRRKRWMVSDVNVYDFNNVGNQRLTQHFWGAALLFLGLPRPDRRYFRHSQRPSRTASVVRAMKETSTVCNNGLRSFVSWLREVQVSDVTGWRWRKRGWLKVCNISGRVYIEQSEIDRFLSRVQSGEFSKQPVVPKPGASKNSARLKNQGRPVATV